MIARIRPHFCLAILSVVLLMTLYGCGDKGTNPIRPGPYQYPPSSTPQITLQSLSHAYSSRDSTAYDSLFDVSYVGTSFDPNTLNPLTFTRADEKRHVQALARTLSISTVSLVFPPTLVRETDGGDPPGWATIRAQNVLIEINDTPDSYHITESVTHEFKFAPTTPSVGSPTDTTWHIVRWTEYP